MNAGREHPAAPGREPLTPEERALAAKLAAAPARGPSPDLDARILLAARAGLRDDRAASDCGGRAPPRVRAHRRWPVAAGAAASLAIAAGLAWQLRPVDELQVPYSEAPRATAPAVPAAAPAADAGPRSAPKAAVAQAPAPADVEAGRAPSAAAIAEDAQSSSTAAMQPPPASPPAEPARPQARMPKAAPLPPQEPPVVFDAPSAIDGLPPSPAPSPAPPAPPAPAAEAAEALRFEQSGEAAAAQAAAAGGETEFRRQRSAASAAAAAAEAPRVQAAPPPPSAGSRATDATGADATRAGEDAAVADAGVAPFDQPVDDQPPASADSPRVQRAWLARVRELLAAGREDAARDSLREYQRRYPQAALPDDLRALLGE